MLLLNQVMDGVLCCRFNDDGSEYVSPRLKTLLRGMPTPHGKHVFFEDDDE
jgi:hypothetical protein